MYRTLYRVDSCVANTFIVGITHNNCLLGKFSEWDLASVKLKTECCYILIFVLGKKLLLAIATVAPSVRGAIV